MEPMISFHQKLRLKEMLKFVVTLFVKNGMEGYDREVRMFLKWWPC